MRLAVTGAHGFLGAHVVDAARAAGHEVVALVSPWGDPARLARHLRDPMFALRRADVTDPSGLVGTLAGCQAVVHAAARVGDHGPWADFHRVNVGGTRHVTHAAVQAGIRRVVLVSSVAVWRYRGIHGDDPRMRPRDQHVLPYGRSKLLAEDVVMAGAPEPVLVRPALWPYGTGDPNLASVVSALRWGVLPLVDGGRARLQTVDARFLARVLVVAAFAPEATGRSYLVADDGAPTWREFLAAIAQRAGASAPRLGLPGAALAALAGPVERAASWLGPEVVPPLTRYRAELMRRDVVFDASAVARELALRPDRSREEALDEAVAAAGRRVRAA